MRSKCPADNRLCPFSPSTSIKPGCTYPTPVPRSRFYEETGSNVSHTNVSRTSQKTNNQLKKALDFKRRKPGMDI
uniref:Uncharacterized protein n=1 Tax=Physcomitrium patens TaxID=3218 RepID=A0A2K1J3B6_PHYPA|nr:hypothetical protein PHYPA_021860 [Physcomitrium patens]